MERYVFAVRDTAFCAWGHDLSAQNERFLKTFDPGYFEYTAQRHIEQLQGENAPRAALALRAAYHHGLESLFSLLAALSQAPGCVAAWIPKCRTETLRQIVRDIGANASVLTQRGQQRLSWELLSILVHSHVWLDEEPGGATAARFAALWTRFASDFLNDLHAHEYNSIKHGFRVSSGGSALRMGSELSYGVPAPDSAMTTLGASPHGTTFDVPEAISPIESRSRHVRLQQHHLRWRAEAMVQALQLLSCSVNNVVGYLRVLNGVPADTVAFNRPDDPDYFEAPWRWNVGMAASTFEYIIDEREVEYSSASELLAELVARSREA